MIALYWNWITVYTRWKYIALLCIFILYTQWSNSNIRVSFSTLKIQNITAFNYNTLPSSSQHLSTDDCMKDRRNDYQNCSMYDNCVQWYAYTHIYEDFTSDCQLLVLWIATTAKQCPHPWSLKTVLMNQHIILHSVLWHTVAWTSGSASRLQINWMMRCWRGHLSGPRCK